MEVATVVQGASRQDHHVVRDESQVGAARRSAQVLAEAHGLSKTDAGRVAIVASELAHNLVLHAGGGELLVQPLKSGDGVTIEVIAIDRGKGMANVERCLQDGFSTNGTTGNGLGAVRRLATEFDIHSTPGHGTIVLARLGGNLPLPFGAICVRVEGEIECGDCWRLVMSNGQQSVLVADGLGHGPDAARASAAAAAAFELAPLDAPTQILERAHRAMSGTRGGAVACASLPPGGALQYAGIGNISGTLIDGERNPGLVSQPGIVGLQVRKIQQFEYERKVNSLLIMHSDGISTRWNHELASDLRGRHPAVIAAALYRDFARARDDASIVVLAA